MLIWCPKCIFDAPKCLFDAPKCLFDAPSAYLMPPSAYLTPQMHIWRPMCIFDALHLHCPWCPGSGTNAARRTQCSEYSQYTYRDVMETGPECQFCTLGRISVSATVEFTCPGHTVGKNTKLAYLWGGFDQKKRKKQLSEHIQAPCQVTDSCQRGLAINKETDRRHWDPECPPPPPPPPPPSAH